MPTQFAPAALTCSPAYNEYLLSPDDPNFDPDCDLVDGGPQTAGSDTPRCTSLTPAAPEPGTLTLFFTAAHAGDVEYRGAVRSPP